MVEFIYLNDRSCQTSSTCLSSYPPVHHSRTIGKEPPSTSRLRINESLSEKMRSSSIPVQKMTYAYRTAHFAGRVSAALVRLLHKIFFFRRAAWVYVDEVLFFFPSSTAPLRFAIAVICLRLIGAPLSWKKLEFGGLIEWNGRPINTMHTTASLPIFKAQKIQQLVPTCSNKLAEKTWKRSWASFFGLRPLYVMLDSYSHLSITIFSLSPQPTTVSHQHSGNICLRSSTAMPPSPS